jgi:hypothetical protein
MVDPSTTARAVERSVVRLLRQQASLAAFGSFAFRQTDLLAILNEAARVCAEGIGVGHAKICRYRPEEEDLLIVAGFGWHEGIVGQVVSQADESSPQGRAFVTGAPVICHDVEGHWQLNGRRNASGVCPVLEDYPVHDSTHVSCRQIRNAFARARR